MTGRTRYGDRGGRQDNPQLDDEIARQQRLLDEMQARRRLEELQAQRAGQQEPRHTPGHGNNMQQPGIPPFVEDDNLDDMIGQHNNTAQQRRADALVRQVGHDPRQPRQPGNGHGQRPPQGYQTPPQHNQQRRQAEEGHGFGDRPDDQDLQYGGGGGEPPLEEGEAPLEETVEIEFDLKPKEVKELLDKDVIGQDRAKKYLSNAICYHYARIRRDQDNGEEHDTNIKKNVLMIGNTGVGKTYLVKKVAKIVGVPFVKHDATKFSSTGYVGGDVEDMIRDLYSAANRNLKLAQYGIVFVDEIDKIRGGATFGKDVNGVEVQRGLLKLMEETEVDVLSNNDPMAAARMTQMAQVNPNAEPPKLNTKNVLFIMSGAFPGLENIVATRTGEEYDNGDWQEALATEDIVGYGMEAEFIGRLPVRVGLKDLSTDDLYKIMKLSGDSVIQQYQNDFASYGIEVDFEDEALHAFAEKAEQMKTGARALTSVIEETMTDFLYELPSTDITSFTVTRELVENPRQAFIELTLDDAVKRAANKFHGETGVFVHFNDAGYNALRARVLETEEDPEHACAGLFGHYQDALKLYRKREFTLDEAAVQKPDEYLTQMTGQEGE
jgi:endopeptidase Clp ATP-binding regulatory subunit ClpX